MVNDLAAAFAFAASVGLDPIVELPRADGESVRLTRNPIGLSATPPSYRLAPPALGEQDGDRSGSP
jgi:crotonobetainyl-CoA:carnitine CoA-transferase CaiB-like acyl-CoA transferase